LSITIYEKEVIMKELMRKMIWFAFGLILISVLGCAPAQKIWTSEPDTGMSSNKYFQARLEPLKQGHNFYVSFRVEVKNLTQNNLAIDWNKTLYIHNGKKKGIFVFKGINPEDIKNKTIPTDIIPSGATFSKVVAPYKLLAKAPLRDRGQSKEIEAGILPSGENGMQLIVRYRVEELVETMKVIITEKANP
jgi:hypothetical protein